MGLSIISFTENGIHLSQKVAKNIGEKDTALFTKYGFLREINMAISVQFVKESIGEWAKKQMETRHTMLFIGACGIAVRAIAPYITDKLYDSPVLVMDEKGKYIIPILSGHIGGANEIAVVIAEKIGALPIITTATDINEKFSVDLFAKKNGLHIVNKDGIAKVSSKVLAGKEITMSIESGHIAEEINIIPYPPKQPVDIVISTRKISCDSLLYLEPKEYVIGMGCKKGKEIEKIEAFIHKSMKNIGIIKKQIFALASIDIKKDEECFLIWCRKENIPFLTFSAEQLNEVEGHFNGSEFVKERVGVDNVCERAALKACGPDGELIYKKHTEDGITIAIAKRKWRVVFYEK